MRLQNEIQNKRAVCLLIGIRNPQFDSNVTHVYPVRIKNEQDDWLYLHLYEIYYYPYQCENIITHDISTQCPYRYQSLSNCQRGLIHTDKRYRWYVILNTISSGSNYRNTVTLDLFKCSKLYFWNPLCVQILRYDYAIILLFGYLRKTTYYVNNNYWNENTKQV